MNKLGIILSLVIILLSFSFCCANKNTTKENHPFKVTRATYNTWVGGQSGVRGVMFVISIDNPEIQLGTIFFRDKKVHLKRDNNVESTKFVGVFTQPNKKLDYILHENPEKEYKNTPPKSFLNIPIKLEENEAAVSYLYKDTIHYYLIKEFKEVKSTVKY